METPDAEVENAFYGNGLIDPDDISPLEFMRSCSANQRWAVCNGSVPIVIRRPVGFDTEKLSM